MKLEIIGFNIESCLTAQQAGADRIELCADPGYGGTTPSYAFIRAAREKLSIALYVMIRPRGGDFLYSEDDFDIMKNDIAACRQLGCDGVVFGILDGQGQIDKKRCATLAELAYPMEATFHRAFDRVSDPLRSLEDIIGLGFERILTSGLKPKAADATPMLAQLVEQAGDRIIIMPGSGVNSQNLANIARETGASEFHSSAGIAKKSASPYSNAQMKESLEYVVVNEEEVRKMAALLKTLSS